MPTINIYTKTSVLKEPQKIAQETAKMLNNFNSNKSFVCFIHEIDIVSDIYGNDIFIQVEITTSVGTLKSRDQIEISSELTQLLTISSCVPPQNITFHFLEALPNMLGY